MPSPHTQIVRPQVQGALVRMERDNNSVYYKRVPTLMPPMAEVVAQGASVFCVRWGLGKTPQSSKRSQGLPALKARGGGEELVARACRIAVKEGGGVKHNRP